jgi:TolA-binding protein
VRRVSTAVWLVVRGLARLSPCKETSPFISVSGDGSTSVLASTAPFSPARELLTLLRFKALAFIVRDLRSFKFLLPILLLTPGLAQAQTAQAPSPDIQRQRIEQLQELIRTKKDLQESLLKMQQTTQQQLAEFDARIAALEASLGVTPSQDKPAQANRDAVAVTPPKDEPAEGNPDTRVSTAALASPGNMVYARSSESYVQSTSAKEEKLGPFPYAAGKGFILARGANGEVDFSTKGYVRYLNQLDLAPTFTDAFGRTTVLDLRQDIQLNRLQVILHGWLFDERFRYFWYAWTQNPSQGDPAQVVVGGNLSYQFSDALKATAGIFSLPSTRSTAQSFPNWLRIDHRSMADEFFRGSYIQGYMVNGELTDTLDDKVAVAGNLSALGVSASQMDNCLCTVTSMLYWMPTTGEFGPGAGFGDYEYHEKLATLLGVHFTYSREDAQEQPGVNAFENSQIRLSDGTLLFAPNAFNTGGMINKATFQMLDLDAGLKWRGWSLDAEYYFRWLDDFKVTGSIPVTSLFDHGFQVYASTMLKPNYWQAYFSGSKIFGQYGDPWDAAVGLTYFPFGHKEVRMNAQALYMDRSAVGYTAVPYVVGGTGWVYTVDVGTWF